MYYLERDGVALWLQFAERKAPVSVFVENGREQHHLEPQAQLCFGTLPGNAFRLEQSSHLNHRVLVHLGFNVFQNRLPKVGKRVRKRGGLGCGSGLLGVGVGYWVWV